MSKFDASLKKYIDIFRNQEMYFVQDLKTLELFQKFPLNTKAEDVQMKLSAINDKDINQNTLMDAALANILELKIDGRMHRGDLTLVEDIAHIS
ncbi:MAG TPA: hypothetical protein VFE57_07645, partial [Cyclobacteriaceae bacterium]|nr:hypothetical protein [Cyclobacteriaceae bacterium]